MFMYRDSLTYLIIKQNRFLPIHKPKLLEQSVDQREGNIKS